MKKSKNTGGKDLLIYVEEKGLTNLLKTDTEGKLRLRLPYFVPGAFVSSTADDIQRELETPNRVLYRDWCCQIIEAIHANTYANPEETKTGLAQLLKTGFLPGDLKDDMEERVSELGGTGGIE